MENLIGGIQDQLKSVDDKILTTAPRDVPALFDMVPLETFGAIQIERPDWAPNLMSWLPAMAPDEVQEAWTGSSGPVLMAQSVSFIRIVTTAYVNMTGKSLRNARVLDFGCGWGRLLRLLYKYVPVEQLYGVDPMEASLQHCRDAGLHGQLFKSEFVPRSLPTPWGVKFDFIFAFSVFTHLSEKVTHISLDTLADHLSDDGVLAITVRPRDYWPFITSHNHAFDAGEMRELLDRHDRAGFAFAPHQGEEIEGEVTYGDTSMTLDYLAKASSKLRIAGIEWSAVDPYQLIVFLRR